METFNFSPEFVKDGLLTFDKKKVVITPERKDSSLSTFENIYIDTVTMMRENNRPDNISKDLIGGAKNPKTQNHNQERNNGNKSILDINKIGSDILKELLDDKLNLVINTGDDARLMKFIISFLTKKSINLDNSEYEYLIRFLRDNVYKMVKDVVMDKHSLAAISEFRMVNDLYSRTSEIPQCGSMMFSQKLAITKEVSRKWQGLSSMSSLMGKTKMESDIIDPLFFILFANKLPGIEDLVIRSDYQSLIQEIKNKEVNRSNMFLFLLRMIDLDFLPTTNKDYAHHLGNETLRLTISMLLRELAYNIRRGLFEDKASCLLTQLLSNVKMPAAKFREENMLQAILATFSFKPTLITRGLLTSKLLQPSSISYDTPKSVYTIEYPISDMYCFSDNNIPSLSQNNFDLLGYDPITKKIIFTYSNNENILNEEKNNLIQNFFSMLANNKIEVDLNSNISLISARQPVLDNLYKDITPVQILLTNGLYISIPREQNRFDTTPVNNIFFRPSFKPSINLSRILVEQIVNVNKINFELVGALCYDIIEDDFDIFNGSVFGSNINSVDISMKLGTFALVKDENTWYEYNPQDMITLERKKSKIEKVLTNIYNRRPEEERNVTFEDWKKNNNNQEKIIQDIVDNKMTIKDMIIDEDKAMDKISTRACLLFYAENYDSYQARIFDKCY